MENQAFKRLEYLNLDFQAGNRRKTIDGVEIFCFSTNQHKHKFHSENTHLNNISDICYQLLHNFEFERSSTTNLHNSLSNLFVKNKHLLATISEKLDFLKNQQNLELLRRLPTQADIEILLNSINSRPKQLEHEIVQIAKQLSVETTHLNNRLQSLELTIQRLEQYIKTL